MTNSEWCLIIAVALFSFCAGFRAAAKSVDGVVSALGAAAFALAFIIVNTVVT